MDDQVKENATVPNFKPFNRLKKCRHGAFLYNENDSLVGRSLHEYGEFAEGEVEIFRRMIKPGSVIVDVGAGTGVHTVALARFTGPDGAVLAFEPQRLLFQTLCANIALNSLTNVYSRNVVVGLEGGRIKVPTLDPTRRINFGAFSVKGHARGEPVGVLTLDALELARCDFMRIDVGEMARDVVVGGEKTIKRFKPVLYVNVAGLDGGRELGKHIAKLGYQLYWHRPPLFSAKNMENNKEDVFNDATLMNMLCVTGDPPSDILGLQEVVLR